MYAADWISFMHRFEVKSNLTGRAALEAENLIGWVKPQRSKGFLRNYPSVYWRNLTKWRTYSEKHAVHPQKVQFQNIIAVNFLVCSLCKWKVIGINVLSNQLCHYVLLFCISVMGRALLCYSGILWGGLVFSLSRSWMITVTFTERLAWDILAHDLAWG